MAASMAGGGAPRAGSCSHGSSRAGAPGEPGARQTDAADGADGAESEVSPAAEREGTEGRLEGRAPQCFGGAISEGRPFWRALEPRRGDAVSVPTGELELYLGRPGEPRPFL